LIVKMGIRTHETFFVSGISEDDSGGPRGLWRSASAYDSSSGDVVDSRLELFPLHRGPSGDPRFLADFVLSGCAGSYGIYYHAYEWSRQRDGELTEIIKQEGALGMSDKVAGYERIGSLRTEGSLITLPYCWFSPIDTWDNPSLCAVDSYDLSSDRVRFLSRKYNRPDLVPVAKAVGYAEQRDYGALLGYCASAQVAQSMIRDLPPDVVAEDVRVTPNGRGKERVEFGSGAFRFDVENFHGRWLVVAFKGSDPMSPPLPFEHF
jgi:hypothetical protein